MITNSSKYAIKALLYLASLPSDEWVQVSAVAERIDVPGPYLAKLMKQLARQEMIESKRGVSGGVRLKSKDLNLFDICKSLDDPIVKAACFLNAEACSGDSPCPFHNEWGAIRQRFLSFLQRSTLRRYSAELKELLEGAKR